VALPEHTPVYSFRKYSRFSVISSATFQAPASHIMCCNISMNNFIYKVTNMTVQAPQALSPWRRTNIYSLMFTFNDSFLRQNVAVHPIRLSANQINLGYHFEGKTGVEETGQRGAR
jgi:hypothetical protein